MCVCVCVCDFFVGFLVFLDVFKSQSGLTVTGSYVQVYLLSTASYVTYILSLFPGKLSGKTQRHGD